MPAILLHNGPVIVMDIKGENYTMTHRHRAASGSKVVCIDPFGIIEDPTHKVGFNPFDLLPYLSDDPAMASRALADMLLGKDTHAADPFWRDASVSVLGALINHYNTFEGPMRSITAIAQEFANPAGGAERPGVLPLHLDFYSRVEADKALLRNMRAIGLGVDQAYEALLKASQNLTQHFDPMDAVDIVQDAITAALEQHKNLVPIEDQEELILDICSAVLFADGAHKKARFIKILGGHHPDTESTHRCLDRLWEVFQQAKTSCDKGLESSSLGYQKRHHDMPDHYPLAIHRLAQATDHMSISTAGQPYASDRTWGSIVTCLSMEIAAYIGESIALTLGGEKSLDLEALQRGDDMTIYLVFPPTRLHSHKALFRTIIEGLTNVLVSRDRSPAKSTLLVLDEVAQLGHMPMLLTAKTLLRGYGVQVWSIWQDISQIKANYPYHWQNLLNNCRVIQTFGKGTGVAAAELSYALDTNPQIFAQLPPDQALLWINGEGPTTVRKVLCYQDEPLRQWCDESALSNHRRNLGEHKHAPLGSAYQKLENWLTMLHHNDCDETTLIAAAASLHQSLTPHDITTIMAQDAAMGAFSLRLLRSWATRTTSEPSAVRIVKDSPSSTNPRTL